jgi:signal transduction histidine kinase
MLDFSQQLVEKVDIILKRWIEAIRQDRQIESAMDLSDMALGNAIPKVLNAMVTVLSISPEDDDLATISRASLEHGSCRAKQKFDSAEIAQEYRLLRQVIFTTLEPDLLKGSPQEVIRAFRLIDSVLDQAISQCFDRYVEERLQELEQLQNHLTLTNHELTRLLQASQDNLAQLAHELRTPLSSIIGYSELLLRQQQRKANPEQVSSSINSIERVLRNGRQLLRLVNDSMELARCEAGKIELHLVSIDVRSIINDTFAIIEPLAQNKGLELQLECDRAPTKVLTDPFRLQQILTNLLSNAVQYTDSGCIKVECTALPDEKWSLAVTDTGVGIAPDDQVRIFEPYSQIFLENHPKESSGIGLGLAIVSRLVDLMQGEIELVSEAGAGSTFTIVWPLKIKTNRRAMQAYLSSALPSS